MGRRKGDNIRRRKGNVDEYMDYGSLIPSIIFQGLCRMTTSCFCLLGMMLHGVKKEVSWSYLKCSLASQKTFKNKKKMLIEWQHGPILSLFKPLILSSDYTRPFVV